MHKFRFLVVDDASFIRDLVKRTLKGQFSGCDIDEAVNGKKAQSLLGKKTYDLVLCDWEMPEVSGLEVLEWLRGYEQESGQSKTPFMMVTSRGDKSHVVKAVQAGVSEYIGKPFSSDQLLKKVIKLLSVNHKEAVKAILTGSKGGGAKSTGNPFESASLLTAKPVAKPKAKASPAGSANLLTAGSVSSSLVDAAPPERKAKPQKAILAKVDIRSPKSSFQADLRDINLTTAVLIIDFTEAPPPTLHEQMVIDIATKNQPENVARINTFVTSMTLQEKSLDCRRALISLQFVDDDPMKMEILSHYVAEVR